MGKEQMTMDRREQLKKRIEEERKKLNDLLESGAAVGDACEQSRTLDRLIEQYMDCQ